MSDKTKKQLILEIFERASMTRLGESEVREVQKRLAELVGEGQATSRGYIARVLAQAGKAVDISDSFTLPLMDAPYEQAFAGVLKFSTLEAAEQSIRHLDALYREYKAARDDKGMAYAREVVRVGKRRAEASARRARSSEVRDVKREIAEWFSLWLSNPDLFDDWLQLRKRSPGYQEKWGLRSGETEP